MCTCLIVLIIQNLYGKSHALCQSMSLKMLFQKAFPLGLIFLFSNNVLRMCLLLHLISIMSIPFTNKRGSILSTS